MDGCNELIDLGDDDLADRTLLVEHLDWVIRPPLAGWFVDQIAEAIELAAAGKDDAWIEVDMKNREVTDVVERWELEELVERAKGGSFRPRRGDVSWRCEPRRAGELTTAWRGDD